MRKVKFSSQPNKSEEKKGKLQIVGDIRENQLLTSFGIGSIVDFLRDTVMIAGTDDWEEEKLEKIFHENLAKLAKVEYFLKPKTSENDMFYNKSPDIPAYVFPEKLYCPYCNSIVDWNEVKHASKKKRNRCPAVKDNKFCDRPLTSARFVVLCENGHIEDFPYVWWVHKGKTCPVKGDYSRITMFNVDNRSDIESLRLKCTDCGAQRDMASAFSKNAFGGESGYTCKGNHPHFPEKIRQGEATCNAILKTRMRSSSSIYFPISVSALSIPPWSKRVVQAIQAKEETLKYMAKDREILYKYIENEIKPKLSSKVTMEELIEIYAMILRKSTVPQTESTIYLDEYTALSKTTSVEEDEYSTEIVAVPPDFQPCLKQVTSVDKLTVIQALVGFTRDTPCYSGDLHDPRIVPLSKSNKAWLPAVKLHGEGIFIQFDQELLSEWASRNEERYRSMGQNMGKSFFVSEKFSPQYVFLHTFSHLFIRAVSEVCGYNTASIREKIYSTFHLRDGTVSKPMSGLLIYLATSDSEGSLGGLISIAQYEEKFEIVLKSMLQSALWCSGDPFCSSTLQQGVHSLNYAACHDCCLLPETSCEIGNVFLDRVAVVGLAEDRSLGFLGEYVEEFL